MFNKLKQKLRDFKNIVLVFFPDNKITVEVVRIGNHYQKKDELMQLSVSGLVLAEEQFNPSKKPRPLSKSTNVLLVPASFEDAKNVEYDAVFHVRNLEDKREFLVYRGREPTNNGGESKA